MCYFSFLLQHKLRPEIKVYRNDRSICYIKIERVKYINLHKIEFVIIYCIELYRNSDAFIVRKNCEFKSTAIIYK